MIQTMTPQQWLDEYVDINKLQEAIIATMIDAIRNENLEDTTYIALVHDIIGGANGIYIPYLALEYFGYEVNTKNIMQYDTESTYWELERFSDELANLINKELPSDISVAFGYWDADGSYCLMAYLDKYEYENQKNESHCFIGEAFGDI